MGGGCDAASAHGLYAHGQRGEAAKLLTFRNDSVQVSERLVEGRSIHLAGGVVAFLNQLLKMTTGDLYGDAVGNDFAGTLLLLDPRGTRKGDGHGAAIDIEADVHGVSVTGAMATILAFHWQWRSSPVQRSVTWKSSYMELAYLLGGSRGKDTGHDWWTVF